MREEFERAGASIMRPEETPNWQAEASQILETLAFHHAQAGQYQQISAGGADSAASLQADLHAVAPRLGHFAETLKSRLQQAGCAVYVPQMGLTAFDTEQRARLVYALTACIGEPSATDARNRQIIWDVAARKTEGDYYASFSEHDGEAAFHTDAQYYPNPENYFALYVMNAARCGGGLSQLCDGQALHAALDKPQTRWALRLLEERALPFRVPSAFVTDERPGVVQAILAPVFSDAPGIRYRRDTLKSGLELFPEHADEDVEQAIKTLEQTLKQLPGTLEFLIPTDSLLLVNNHRALHARGAFKDAKRHLLRVRIHDVEYERNELKMITLAHKAAECAIEKRSIHHEI